MIRSHTSNVLGITIVELLVVIAIIAVLLQLILPAIQAARGTARRTDCSSNLRQLGTAIQEYESAHRLLPPGWVRNGGVDHNYVQYLLPYIDESSIYDQYDFSVGWKDPKNKSIINTEISTVRCPSAPHDHPYITDYSVYIDVMDSFFETLVNENVLKRRSNTRGALRGEPSPIAQITDGVSKTIFLCEDSGRPDKYWFGHRLVTGIVIGGRWANPTGRFEINARCNGSSFKSGSQLMNCTNRNEIYSFHQNGANFLFGDASVQLIHEDIDPDVLISMLTATAGD